MNDMTIHGGNVVTMTMTSREIAELTGKEHKNVIRDIRNMLDALGKDRLSFEHISKDAYGRDQQGFKLDRELTLTLVSGYDIPLRHRVVTRLAELEARPAQTPIPQTLPEALRLAADLAEQRNVAQAALAIAAPKAEALDMISAGADSLTITETAKVLGMKRNDLTIWMHANGWTYRLNGAWVGYDRYIKSGHLEYKEANYTDEKTGMACKKPYCHVTPKGLAKLAEAFSTELKKAA